MSIHTPTLSHYQVFKKGSSKHSMNLGLPYQYDSEMWYGGKISGDGENLIFENSGF